MRHAGCRLWCAVLLQLGANGFAQAPFLSYDFEDDSLDDFVTPTSISYCANGIIPTGTGTIDAGELLITNDDMLGIGAVVLHPDIVASSFPVGSRNYSVKLRFSIETVNEILVYMRSRLGIDEAAAQIDSQLERGYPVVVVPNVGGPAGLPANGALIISEFTGCHTLVQHPEWPGAAGTGFAVADPGTPIVPGQWYWLEISTQGREDGGPTQLTAKLWDDGNDPPETPQLTVIDANGLILDPPTRDPAADPQFYLGTSFDFDQQLGGTARFDDISFTQLTGCETAPVKVTRTLWGETVTVEGNEVALYADGIKYDVQLSVTDRRPAGECNAPLSVTLTETLPVGWTASNITNAGTARDNVITWNVSLTAGVPARPLAYKAMAAGTGLVNFQGEFKEPGSTFSFATEGQNLVANEDVVAPISDFGSIQHWLILGPFTRQVGGAAPGDDELVRDYLTDGAVTEDVIQPKAGDTIEPDYNGDAASTGLAPNLAGRNPDDIPTWIGWQDRDDDDDRIDFETVYGDVDEVMCYAVTYLNVSEDIVVNFGVSSDDSVHILLDGAELHKNNIPRGALGRSYQDLPFAYPSLGNVTLTEGQHTLLVKVFEGGGEHNFRVGFVDDSGFEIAGGPPEVTISLEPIEGPAEPVLRRGDADANGQLEITDAIFTLNFLFSGGRAPSCPDAADVDDNAAIEITDPIRGLGYLFLGGPPPAPPGPDACGVDPTEDALALCAYEPPAGSECQ